MIDATQYGHAVNSSDIKFVAGAETYSSGEEALLKLSEEATMTCHHSFRGFSLRLKRWCMFQINNVTKITYNSTAFDGLILSAEKKSLISSLLSRPDIRIQDTFDDLIDGKGKGVVFLLYGPPGVGKTYTAG